MSSHPHIPAREPSEAPTLGGFAPVGGGDAVEGLPQLLDAAFSGEALPHVLSAVAGWWQQRLPDRRIALGIAEDLQQRLVVAVTDTTTAPCVSALSNCLVSGEESLRGRLLTLLDQRGDHDWIPLGDRGRVIGGLVLSPSSTSPSPAIPAVWIDVTARLLAHALDRDPRLLNAKLASLAEFAAGAGHEINNPLGTIVGRAQQLARDERDPERRRALHTIGAQALRIRDMIGDTMTFARPPTPQLASVDLGEQLDMVLSRFDDEIRRRHVRIEGSRPRGIIVSADPTQLAVVLSELLRNSLHAVPEGGIVELSAASLNQSVASVAELIVRDNGPGLSPSEREHLFDPFYSGRQAGRGLGFGLSKCWRIVSPTGAMLIMHLPCAINTSTTL
jgi:signal transduction histidine kinase